MLVIGSGVAAYFMFSSGSTSTTSASSGTGTGSTAATTGSTGSGTGSPASTTTTTTPVVTASVVTPPTVPVPNTVKLADDNSCGWNVWGGAANNGTQIALYKVTGATNEKFTFNADGTITNQGKCVDLASSNTANGTKIQMYDCNKTNAQIWQHSADPGPIKHRASGKCIDLPNSGKNSGNAMQIYDCNGTGAQNWSLGGVF